MPEHTPAPNSARGVYGFVLYLFLRFLFCVYLIWAVIPEKWFIDVGITYLPQRHWAVTIPLFIMIVILLFGFVIYPSINLCITPEAYDIRTVTDKSALKRKEFQIQRDKNEKCICKNSSKCGKAAFDKINQDEFLTNSVPPIYDLNIVKVSEHLYL